MAKRLIDAEALKRKAVPEEESGEGVVYVQDIDEAPTVDAVEVVRCRNCIHDGLSTCPMCYIEDKTLVFVNHDPDFYCGNGECKGGQAPQREDV